MYLSLLTPKENPRHRSVGPRIFEWGFKRNQPAVPVEAAYQVWRVTKVLSMGKIHTHILEDTQKRFKIKPWEIFEKIHF